MKAKQKYQIDKVKLSERGCHIEYTIHRGQDNVHAELDSKDAPRPEFTAAMAALVDDVIDLCDLPVSYTKECVVRSVSFVYVEDGRMGATIGAVKWVTRTTSVFNIHTPFAEEAEEEDAKAGLEKPTVKRLQAVIEEASLYLDGNRAQQVLPLREALHNSLPKE